MIYCWFLDALSFPEGFGVSNNFVQWFTQSTKLTHSFDNTKTNVNFHFGASREVRLRGRSGSFRRSESSSRGSCAASLRMCVTITGTMCHFVKQVTCKKNNNDDNNDGVLSIVIIKECLCQTEPWMPTSVTAPGVFTAPPRPGKHSLILAVTRRRPEEGFGFGCFLF